MRGPRNVSEELEWRADFGTPEDILTRNCFMLLCSAWKDVMMAAPMKIFYQNSSWLRAVNKKISIKEAFMNCKLAWIFFF